ncbi:unnamed protein product [Brassica rapa subsp. trilocularis]
MFSFHTQVGSMIMSQILPWFLSGLSNLFFLSESSY